MRPAGRFVAAVLTELAERTRVGSNVLELDRIAHAMIREHRATSCYIDDHLSFGAMPVSRRGPRLARSGPPTQSGQAQRDRWLAPVGRSAGANYVSWGYD